ncbi:hypothetical protein SAMN06269185_1836 [Natronoarchaeum philippinense]|uniref:Uncharacterized protein n=1 Tax=Natronoarchaeum philippinense TaxID=558529 RepID=A0A285NT49_NATPI|nr:hypothetical protein [Natronoarchaeum philippinense]SNZ12619.1 hypothetical protein SAMN06269185_1836 [Natronoarchaeum philippinense]
MTPQAADPARRRRRTLVVRLLVAAVLLAAVVGASIGVPALQSDDENDTTDAGNDTADEESDEHAADENDTADDEQAEEPPADAGTAETTPENEAGTPPSGADVPGGTPQPNGTVPGGAGGAGAGEVGVPPGQPPEGTAPTPGANGAVTGPPTLAGLDENITVAVASDESVRASTSTTVEFEVTNEDDDDELTDVVVTLAATGGAVGFGSFADPQRTQSVYIEELDPDETESFEVDVLADAVEPGTYPLFASVQYTVDEDGDDDDDGNDEDDPVVNSGPAAIGLPVTDALAFEVTPVDGSVPVDETAVYRVQITNEGETNATDVVAGLTVGTPLSSESPTAYVGDLAPGDSETVRFGLESSSDAIETTTGATLTITYEAGDGDRSSAEPVSVPVSVVEDEGADVDTTVPFAVAAAVVVIAAIWWLRRR